MEPPAEFIPTEFCDACGYEYPCSCATGFYRELTAMTELEHERIKTESARSRWLDCQNRLAEYERIGIEATGAVQSIPDAFAELSSRVKNIRNDTARRCAEIAGKCVVDRGDEEWAAGRRDAAESIRREFGLEGK